MEAIFAILISVGLGYWADSHFGTEPVWLIVGAIIGFAAFVLRLFRLSKLVQETAEAAETETQRSVAQRPEGNETILPGTDRRPSDDDDRSSESGDARRVDL